MEMPELDVKDPHGRHDRQQYRSDGPRQGPGQQGYDSERRYCEYQDRYQTASYRENGHENYR